MIVKLLKLGKKTKKKKLKRKKTVSSWFKKISAKIPRRVSQSRYRYMLVDHSSNESMTDIPLVTMDNSPQSEDQYLVGNGNRGNCCTRIFRGCYNCFAT